MARGGVKVPIDGDASGLRRATVDAEHSLDRLHRAGSRSLHALGTAAASAGVALGAGLAAGVAVGTRELIQQEQVAGRTANVIKTTGGAAGVTAKQVEELANKLQSMTGTQDDVIQGGANVILTFTEIHRDVFPRTVAAANDLSVAMGKDMTASSRMLGKAMNDPINGLGALSRAGVKFTDDEKARMKTLVESNRMGEAQAIILQKVEQRFKGAASSQGQITEATQKAQRMFEEYSEQLAGKVLPIVIRFAETIQRHWPEIRRVTIEAFEGARRIVERVMVWYDQNIVPTIRSIVRNAKRFWNEYGDQIKTTFEFVWRTVKRLLATLREAIAVALALIRGDWGGAWKHLKELVVIQMHGILDFLATIPKLLAVVGNKMGKALSHALLGALDGLGQAIVDKITGGHSGPSLSDLVPGGVRNFVTGPLNQYFPATGGFIPGRFDARDDVPAMLSRGEVVLNPGQQRHVGIDRIVNALHATGALNPGLRKGPGFAAGGYVADAYQRATSKLGTAYHYGTWDCSKFATYVAGVDVGGTTASAHVMSSPARGNEPIVWGFKKRHAGNYIGGPLEHMGVKVAGRWFDNGGGGVQSDANSAVWEETRVPHGLERLAAATSAGASPDTRAATRGAGHTISPMKRLSNLLALALGFPKGVQGPGGATLRRATPGVRDISGGLAGGSFSDYETRDIGANVRAAGAAERARPGSTPDTVAAAQTEQERASEVKWLLKHLTDATTARDNLVAAKKDLLRDYARLAHAKPTTAAGRAAKQKLMKANRAKRRAITNEIRDVLGVIAEIKANLADIGDQRAADQFQVSYDAAQEAAAKAADAAKAAADAASEAGQEALDKANTAAAGSAREAMGATAFAEALRTSGDIDPGGGVTVVQHIYGSVIQESQAASWIVDAMNRQGAPSSSVLASGA